LLDVVGDFIAATTNNNSTVNFTMVILTMMRRVVTSLPALVILTTAASRVVEGGDVASHDILLDRDGVPRTYRKNSNATNPFHIFSAEELEAERRARKQRILERREKAKEFIRNAPPPRDAEQLDKLSDEQVQRLGRKLGWFSNTDTSSYSSTFLADPSAEYDKWAQAYRMLGGFIDCDHDKDGSGSGGGGGGGACSRWMLWAAVRCFVGGFLKFRIDEDSN